jgi:peptide/nickel transport system permease protein
MEQILAQRRLYGLDKPIFFNFNGESRSWFAGSAIHRASLPIDQKSVEVDRKIARRELLDQSTALYPDLIPALAQLKQNADIGQTLQDWRDDAKERAEELADDEAEPEAWSELKKELQAEAKEAKLGRFFSIQSTKEDAANGEEKPEGSLVLPKSAPFQIKFNEEGRYALQAVEKFSIALETLEKSARHPLPKDYAKLSEQDKIDYWAAHWEGFVPGGKDLDLYVNQTVREAIKSSEGKLANEVMRLGPLATPILLELLHETDKNAETARILSYLARVQRKPGWRPDPRLIGDYMRDEHFPRDATKRQELSQQFITAIADDKREAIAADPEVRAQALEEMSTFWHLPVLYDLYFHIDDYGVKAEVRKTIDAALLANKAELSRTKGMRGWPAADAIFEGITDAKKAQIAKWWKRAQYRYLEFGLGASAWHVISNTQFGAWMGKMLRFDFDESYKHKRPVLDIIMERLPITLTLSFLSIFLAYAIAIPLGIKSAVDYHSTSDKVITFFLFVLYSLPSFWVGEMLIIYFCSAEFYNWFPSNGAGDASIIFSDNPFHWLKDRAYHLFLPVACLTYGSFASLSRYMRSSMLETIRQDFIRTARAKGLSERVVVYKHALRNSLIPILTLAATMLPALISGSVIIETVFTINGMGKLAVEAVFDRDYPLINAIAIFSAALTLFGILLSDLSYALVDPRITYE